jgi:hypothetical protein
VRLLTLAGATVVFFKAVSIGFGDTRMAMIDTKHPCDVRARRKARRARTSGVRRD